MTIQGGLEFIASRQRKDGGFWEYALEPSEHKYSHKYRTIFTPALIALALKDIPEASDIKMQCARFLLEQKSPDWSWNYWARLSAQSKTLPYPDDLDDTFLALSALWYQDKKLFSPAVSAAVAHLLFATEQEPGGPYRSWLVDESADKVWQDVDAAVNSNIGGFLALQGIELPGVTGLIEEAIDSGKLRSPYYVSPMPLIYFLSKWYRGVHADTLRNLVCDGRQAEGYWGTPHDTALAVIALIHLGHTGSDLQRAIDYIGEQQLSDGSWQANPVCIGPGGKRSGAPSLTTAFCLEALALYQQSTASRSAVVRSDAPSGQHDEVVRTVRKQIAHLRHDELRQQTDGVFSQILARDIDSQIIRLPWLIAQALDVEVDKQLAHNLAAASVWGWMAYTVYDDFLDDEGSPRLLPSAVYAQRQLMDVLRGTLPNNVSFQDEITAIMDRLDQANVWEAMHCRWAVDGSVASIADLPDYGDYWQLADRSLGHTIAGLGVLYGTGYGGDSERVNGLREFFHHYLIARQLNDDAHDWQPDLERGQINAVAVRILDTWIKRHESKRTIDLVEDIEELQQIMWESVIDRVCEDIFMHLENARSALVTAGAQGAMLASLLEPLEGAARTALRTRDDALEFIALL